ncbi:DNA polymerase III subunit epsilon [Paenibacillus yonginensis]|uniref:DNA polymerase III subunit epsilon n=1 Tax=Paenibacillus yonginensis TaxID=1462996 RepID=A0A1B1MXH5_9BACL|nr:exonuclease domain-containing protein [Paenibacillus yonginensis]ANS73847.1 DNA polymerase III subunit epsilon [Paenibacillus yonginensis]
MKEPDRTHGLWNAIKNRTLPSAIASKFGTESAEQIAFLRSLNKGLRRPETLHVQLKELKTAVFDLETTGFHPKQGDEILSFGAVRVEGIQVRLEETHHVVAKTSKPVPEEIVELTGITQEMADQAPPLVEALHDFMSFVDDRVLIAHCSGHDKAFLDMALWRTSKSHLSHRVLDTMMIAQRLHEDSRKVSLDDWLHWYGIPITRRHHALEDAKMTAFLWTALIDQLRERGVYTLGDLYVFLSHS